MSRFGRYSGFLAKLVAITLVAGAVWALVYLTMIRFGIRDYDARPLVVLYYATAGNLLVGFPVALLTLQFSGRHMARSLTTFAMIVALAAIMVVLASFAIGGAFIAYWIGLPSIAAVLTYALLGWFWIVTPLRSAVLQGSDMQDADM
ncbi:MAG: hypothetical protein QNI87_04275 [Erythrobacter sp.]|uniref:hypothetical protein n=1 Tax=Erythrobacter sp. TaxID=1042 RepID=UPI0026105FE0|nr:hypothetical protein [Erythrobacter sp.]MDJ0977731.1 hypothetical protein [Erythrobacter sp.]